MTRSSYSKNLWINFCIQQIKSEVFNLLIFANYPFYKNIYHTNNDDLIKSTVFSLPCVLSAGMGITKNSSIKVMSGEHNEA
ncbi:Uncharacterized protein dnm_020360 [Desulfonema magnum]|uniref:Uncharacterized protein n=1 Tax=Desulfonema magnum TaxID=45655 RepID=A0A975BIK7_9BACT|nr:Uncharacterized protein dnm_020360 [Desulfonema magnum]